jgi:hypothetical protein
VFGLHIAALSDGILPLFKIDKILSDKVQYVAMHRIMTAPLFELQRNGCAMGGWENDI